MKKPLSRIILFAICGVALSMACHAAQATPELGTIRTETATTTAMSAINTPIPTTIYAPEPTGPTPCAPANRLQEAYVSRVIDGGTIEVTIGEKRYKVRYIGIEPPEATTEEDYFANQATAKNSGLVEGKLVTLVKDVSEADKDDRLLRYVFAGEVFVNYELVKEGYALAYAYPPDVSCADTFLKAQQYARENNKGLWGPTPIPLSP